MQPISARQRLPQWLCVPLPWRCRTVRRAAHSVPPSSRWWPLHTPIFSVVTTPYPHLLGGDHSVPPSSRWWPLRTPIFSVVTTPYPHLLSGDHSVPPSSRWWPLRTPIFLVVTTPYPHLIGGDHSVPPSSRWWPLTICSGEYERDTAGEMQSGRQLRRHSALSCLYRWWPPLSLPR